MTDSAENEARGALAACATEIYPAMRDAATAYGKAHSKLLVSTDLVESMRCMIGLIEAAELLTEIAKKAEHVFRAELHAQMEFTGAPNIVGAFHTAVLAKKPMQVYVTDASLLPPELMVVPEPKPDMVEIAKRVRAGEQIPGTAMSNQQEHMLQLRSNKEG